MARAYGKWDSDWEFRRKGLDGTSRLVKLNQVRAALGRAGFFGFSELTVSGPEYPAIRDCAVYFGCRYANLQTGVKVELSCGGRLIRGDVKSAGKLVADITQSRDGKLLVVNHALDVLLES